MEVTLTRTTVNLNHLSGSVQASVQVSGTAEQFARAQGEHAKRLEKMAADVRTAFLESAAFKRVASLRALIEETAGALDKARSDVERFQKEYNRAIEANAPPNAITAQRAKLDAAAAAVSNGEGRLKSIEAELAAATGVAEKELRASLRTALDALGFHAKEKYDDISRQAAEKLLESFVELAALQMSQATISGGFPISGDWLAF